MAELRCNQQSCNEQVLYLDAGSGLCEEHFRVRKSYQRLVNARWIYLIGLGVWLLFWVWLFSQISSRPSVPSVGVQSLRASIIAVYSGNRSLLAIPFVVGLIPLIVNLLLWWRSQDCADYATEVDIIEFVERNASWFLIASVTFLTAAAFFLTRPPGSGAAVLQLPPLAHDGLVTVLLFESASLLFLLSVVLLHWIPSPHPRKLAMLRHIKTLPFTFGVAFFAAAFTAMIRAAVS